VSTFFERTSLLVDTEGINLKNAGYLVQSV
jgi:hypothetical protein